MRADPGAGGIRQATRTAATIATAATPRTTVRQLTRSEAIAPSGTPSAMATAMPEKTRASAADRCRGGTTWAAYAPEAGVMTAAAAAARVRNARTAAKESAVASRRSAAPSASRATVTTALRGRWAVRPTAIGPASA
jgi:hypothetical protein